MRFVDCHTTTLHPSVLSVDWRILNLTAGRRFRSPGSAPSNTRAAKFSPYDVEARLIVSPAFRGRRPIRRYVPLRADHGGADVQGNSTVFG